MLLQGASLREFLPILVRWIAFSRSGLPVLAFKLHHWLVGGAFWAGLTLALLATWRGLPLLAALAGTVPIAINWMMNDPHRRLGGAPLNWKFGWVGLALWLMAPIIYARTLTRSEVAWRGRRYRLDPHGRLAMRFHSDGGNVGWAEVCGLGRKKANGSNGLGDCGRGKSLRHGESPNCG